MTANRFRKKLAHTARVSLAILTAIPFSLGGTLANAAPPDKDHEKQHNQAQSPIQHVIVLIGENRTFDHVFATYIPRHGESVSNLLSKGIVNADGTPGPHFKKAQQFQAVAPFRTKYFISLDKHEKAPYDVLPEPTLNFSPNGTTPPPFPSATPPSILDLIEPSLETTDLNLRDHRRLGRQQYLHLPDPDTRVENFSALRNGPFHSKAAAYP
jgi:phospholipase C